MRVLHILNDVTDKGNGIVNAAIDLAAGQRQRGDEVIFVSAGGGHEALLESMGVRHFRVDFSRKPLRFAGAILALGRHILSFRPDVLHAHVRTGLLVALPWAKLLRLPLVSHLHNVHERESLIMCMADRVIAVSQSVGETLVAHKVSRDKIRVVLNGPLGSPRLPPVESLALPDLQHPALVTIAGMNHRKGITELITAFDQVADQMPAAHLYLVGDGPDIQEFRSHAASVASRDRIHFEGFQPMPQAYMRAADVLLLASRRESFGLVLTEGREAGCAIAASDVDGIPEALDQGQAGLLFPPGDIEQIGRCMLILTNDLAQRTLWQQRARVGLERFRITAYAQEVAAVYHELLQLRSSVATKRAAEEQFFALSSPHSSNELHVPRQAELAYGPANTMSAKTTQSDQ